MNKEKIRELLEKRKKEVLNQVSNAGEAIYADAYNAGISYALALLEPEQEPCPKCRGTGKKIITGCYGMVNKQIDCDCQDHFVKRNKKVEPEQAGQSEFDRTPAGNLTEKGISQYLRDRCHAVEAKLEAAEDGLTKLQNWCKAYPLEAFPKPDLKKAAKVLKASGMTLDEISADNMRHVLEGVQKIIEQALKDKEKNEN